MKFLLTISITVFVLSFNAQQDYFFSMFWNNYSSYNPAASGATHNMNFYTLGRDQWTGIKNNPITFQVGGDVRLESIKSGVGLNYTYDNTGYTKT